MNKLRNRLLTGDMEPALDGAVCTLMLRSESPENALLSVDNFSVGTETSTNAENEPAKRAILESSTFPPIPTILEVKSETIPTRSGPTAVTTAWD
mmetsp:Transcript_33163/g.53773  ORF Transcript_33163/g.53773 Transcript_33163/m.53773 type:complete len:95 (-) Transcript_33163:155-439(-)